MAVPREVKVKVTDCCFDTPILLLGKVGENLATKVMIDASEWQDDSGTYQLLVKRADEELFTATIEQEDGVITWLIPAAEIGAAGYGEIELNYIVDEVKMKSARVDTRVFSSIEIDSLPPNGLTWSQMVLAAVQDARDAAENAARSQSASEESAEDSSESATLAESYAKGGTMTREGEDTDNAKYYKEQAAQSATMAGNKANEAIQAKDAAVEAKNQAVEVYKNFTDKLKNAQIFNTTETASFDSEGRLIQIIHTDNDSGDVVRTDTFTYTGDVITELRTLPTGETQKNTYDMLSFVFKYDV